MVERWWRTVTVAFWTECGLKAQPGIDEVQDFFASVGEQLKKAPTTVVCLAQLIGDLASCGVGPVARIDPNTLTTIRATWSRLS